MPRHHAPASSSFRYLAASDLDLIVGGAGKQDTLAADPYLPGGSVGGGDAGIEPAVTAGAADGPGFTWPADMQDPLEVAPADEAPHMCGTTIPDAPAGGDVPADDWVSAAGWGDGDLAGGDVAGGDVAGGASWASTIDSSAGWEGSEPPMTLDGEGGDRDDGGGCGDDEDDAADDEGDVQLGDAPGQAADDPLSWSSTVSAAPNPTTSYERPPAAADVNSVGAQPVAPPMPAADAGNLLDWAFSPRGPVAGAVGGDVAQNIWSMLDRAGADIGR